MEPTCAICGAIAPHRCASCQSVSYCSAEHQKNHWKVHRRCCVYFKVVDDPNLGKGLIARRDIKPGTVILDEEPVTVSPSNRPMLACLTCGLDDELTRLFGRKCSRCKWPVCSLECENHPIHAENECQIFASGKVIHDPVSTALSFEYHVMGLRVCLLKKRDPQLYQKILGLCSEYNLPHEDRTEAVQFENYLRKVLGRVPGLSLDSKEMAKLLRIFRLNCLSGEKETKSTGLNPDATRNISGLYLKSSRFNHSCVPNCHFEVGSMPDFKIRIRTTREVKKDEPLTIFYWVEEALKTTETRQKIFRNIGHFRCECVRCKDPTEVGTYSTGIVCKTCQKKKTTGYFLQVDPLNFSPNAKWKCSSCSKIQLARDILQVLQPVRQRISEMARFSGTGHPDHKLIDFCKHLVDETSGIILHPNHWLIQTAMTLVGKCLFRNGLTSSERCEYFAKCWKFLLSIQEILTPGITQGRANKQVELAEALHIQYGELLSQGKYEQAQQKCEERLLLLNEALEFFKNDLPGADGVVPKVCTIEKNIAQAIVDRTTFQLKQLTVCECKK